MRPRSTPLLLLAALLGCSAQQSTDAQPQTAGWAPFWADRHREKLAELAAKTDVDMIWLGDSLVHYWEREGQAVWSERYAPRGARNLGFSGDSTEHLLWRVRNGEVDGLTPRLAILLIGTNNAGLRREKPEQTAAGIRAIVDELLVRLPGAKVLVLALLPRGTSTTDPVRLLNERTNRLVARFADGRRVFFLDVGARLLGPDGVPPLEIMTDHVHLSSRGYAILADAIAPELERLAPLRR